MKLLLKSNKLKEFIATKMNDLITFFDKNGEYSVYTWGNINGIYSYLEMIVSTTTFTTSVQHSHHFGPSSYINNNTAYLHPFLEDIRMTQKSSC